jgi:hypothetical protein
MCSLTNEELGLNFFFLVVLDMKKSCICLFSLMMSLTVFDFRTACELLNARSTGDKMPLSEADKPINLPDIPQSFIIFYSSKDQNGKMWCPVS